MAMIHRAILHSRGNAVYTKRNEDTDATEELLLMDVDTWDEMGRPEVITITVDAGDRLNS